MTEDEARERAVVFRAALTLCADAIDRPEMLLVDSKSIRALLERYPFDIDTVSVIRKMAEEARIEKGLLVPPESEEP